MKTINHIIHIILISTVFGTTATQAQMSPYKFNQQFDIAFEHLLEGNTKSAADIFQKLHAEDSEHGQVAFLLGLCQFRNGEVTERTFQSLKTACTKYDYYHQRGLANDRTVPASAWLYLAKVSAELGEKQTAINAYRNYMSCIPMASTEHKREVMYAIKALKQKPSGEGTGSVLASMKP